MSFQFAFPPDHDERMRVLEQTTASLGWGRDDDMTMLERKAQALLQVAQRVLEGKEPLLRPLVAEFIGLCAQLNIERHAGDKETATQLLAVVDKTRDELRRLWANPHLPEIRQQLALVDPLYKRLNDRLNSQWSECRSESVAEECSQLGAALRLRQRQLAERSPLQAQAV